MARSAREPLPSTNGPVEGGATVGVDESPDQRPGFPKETVPRPDEGSHWTEPTRQPGRRTHLRRKGLDRLTPVFGTATPPRGMSGLMRRVAYRVPEHRARHWLMLIAADRVDVMEGRIGEAIGRPLRRRGLHRVGHAVEMNPAAAFAGAVVGAAALMIGTTMLIRRLTD